MNIGVELLIIFVFILFCARILWRLANNTDPLTAVVPSSIVQAVSSIPKVLTRASREKHIDELWKELG